MTLRQMVHNGKLPALCTGAVFRLGLWSNSAGLFPTNFGKICGTLAQADSSLDVPTAWKISVWLFAQVRASESVSCTGGMITTEKFRSIGDFSASGHPQSRVAIGDGVSLVRFSQQSKLIIKNFRHAVMRPDLSDTHTLRVIRDDHFQD